MKRTNADIVSVPEDLTSLSRDDLENLVRSLDAQNKKQRVALQDTTNNGNKHKGKAKAKAKAAEPPAPKPDKKEVQKLRSSIAKKLHTKVKQSKLTTHTSKPKIELSVGMTLEMLKALLDDGMTPKKDTKSLFVVDYVNPFEVFPALPDDLQAKWAGKMKWLPMFGPRPSKVPVQVYMDPLTLHFKKKENLLVIKTKVKKCGY